MQPLGFLVDGLDRDRRFHVVAAIIGRRRVGQEEGVELDQHRPPEAELQLDLVGKRADRLHFVDIDAVERLDVAPAAS